MKEPKKYELSGESEEKPVVGISHEKQTTEEITHINLMGVILPMHIAIIHFVMTVASVLSELLFSKGRKGQTP